MPQMQLPMLTVYEGPALVAGDAVDACESYRDAVRLCWSLRRRSRMSTTAYAAEIGCYASHLAGYVHEFDGRRELPAKHIAAFEVSCGNRAITQWLTARANLTIMETFIARKAA